jgi:3-phenylpropionate/cinnamic acid dioxygenase small subunit
MRAFSVCDIPHEISRQLRDYAMACDTHDWPRLAALFERGKFHFATEAGPEAVLRWGQEVVRPDARTQHVISTVHVDVDDEAGVASGTCYLTLFHSDHDIQLVSACYFENEWVREDGRWWWRTHRIVPLFRGDSTRIHTRQQFPAAVAGSVTAAPAS